MNQFLAISSIFLLVGLSGCATTHVSVSPYPDRKQYEAVKPEKVMIYRDFPRQRAFKRLGEVSVEATQYDQNQIAIFGNENAASVENKLREAGAKLGADGVVLMKDGPAVSGETTNYGISYNNSNNQSVTPSMVTLNGSPVPGYTYTGASGSSALSIDLPHHYESGRKVYGIAIKFSEEGVD